MLFMQEEITKFHEFIENFLDKPWIRVVFFEFNDIQFND